jgi:hypothetical protein
MKRPEVKIKLAHSDSTITLQLGRDALYLWIKHRVFKMREGTHLGEGMLFIRAILYPLRRIPPILKEQETSALHSTKHKRTKEMGFIFGRK